jgi:hypothetical protein
MTPPSLAVLAHIDRTFPLARGPVILVNMIDMVWSVNRVDECDGGNGTWRKDDGTKQPMIGTGTRMYIHFLLAAGSRARATQ